MRQRQGGLSLRGYAIILSLLLVGFLGPVPTEIFAGEADRSPKGKPAAKADFVLTIKDNLIFLEAKNASLKRSRRRDRAEDEH